MSTSPVLVMQMRRMGDLILTFPLLHDLRRLHPQNPLWIAAQPCFYEHLLPFAPPGTKFFSQHDLPKLAGETFETVINLGGPPILARYAAKFPAHRKLGQIMRHDALHIEGFWHLYRESLTCNNHPNAFHWADLFRMDVANFPLSAPPSPGKKSGNAIGLFLGASEAMKRPDPLFFGRLARKLAHDGYKVVLLGGPGEVALGHSAMVKNTPATNLCGKTTVAQLGAILQNLDLLITPDTGPMHLANLVGTPVLNLSMGNVHAQDTGPYSPGQYILSPAMSCKGCWECARKEPFCRNAFEPWPIGKLANAIIKNTSPLPDIKGLRLYRTAKDENGLHCLTGSRTNAPAILEKFWKEAFLDFADSGSKSSLAVAASALKEKFPALAISLGRHSRKILKKMAQCGKNGLPENFWATAPKHSRLFAGHLQMTLQNENFSAPAIRRAVARAEKIVSMLE